METNAQHYTNASFHKTLYTLGKICATSDKTTTTKTTEKKKQKNIEKTKKKRRKKRKNLGFQGKVLGVASPKSLVFFLVWFSRVFLFFLVFWFARAFCVFVFFDFSNDFSEVFSEVLPFGLFITDFAQTAPFPQNFVRAAPQHVCNIFSKANSFFISLLLGKSLLE